MKVEMCLYLLFFIVLLGCSHSTSNENITKIDSVELGKKETRNEKKENRKVEFVYSNDSLEQKILIDETEKNKLDFEYVVRHKTKNYIKVIKGVAKDIKPDMDPELDEDEEGFGYPVIEYLYEENGCIVYIRRAMIEKDKIQIKTDCDFLDKFCPIESVGILRKK